MKYITGTLVYWFVSKKSTRVDIECPQWKCKEIFVKIVLDVAGFFS